MSFNRAGLLRSKLLTTLNPGEFVMHPLQAKLMHQPRAGWVPSMPPRPPARPSTIKCESCGAPVHPHERACSYCKAVP